MPRVIFTEDFDYKPHPQQTYSYKTGDEALVKQSVADIVIGLGKAELKNKTNNKNEDVDGEEDIPAEILLEENSLTQEEVVVEEEVVPEDTKKTTKK